MRHNGGTFPRRWLASRVLSVAPSPSFLHTPILFVFVNRCDCAEGNALTCVFPQVGHTGIYDAAVEAIGHTDAAVGTVYGTPEKAGTKKAGPDEKKKEATP